MRLIAVRLVLMLCLFAALLPAQSAKARQHAPPPAKRPPTRQEPPAPTPGEVPIFRGGVTVVTAPVTVTNENGDFVNGLQPQDFRLFDNETQQQIAVEPSEVPISLVVAVSNSSRIEPLLKEIQKVGILFSQLVIGERGEAAVITYDHRIEVIQDFTNDPDKLGKAFKDLKLGSEQAHLSDAIVRALTMLRDRPALRRKVIVAIGEGRDRGSESEVGYVLREAQIGGIPIYTVILSSTRTELTRQAPPPRPSPFPPGATGTYPGIPPTPTAEMQTRGNVNIAALMIDLVKGVKGLVVQNPMEVYARGTGGRDLHGFKSRAVQDAITRIGNELHSQYLVTYRPSNLHEAGFHSIRVIVDRPGVKVVTRPGYYFAGSGSTEASRARQPSKPGE